MNLSKLFDLQKAVDAQYSNVDDRLSKDILWLMEELGELAREWRGHKYRRPAEEQTPRTTQDHNCGCFKCEGCQDTSINPLLEEYTDCLSIILSIGLQDMSLCPIDWEYTAVCSDSVIKQFMEIQMHLWLLYQSNVECDFEALIRNFIGLGEMLGFTWEQIEENYIAKVEANKQRNC